MKAKEENGIWSEFAEEGLKPKEYKEYNFFDWNNLYKSMGCSSRKACKLATAKMKKGLQEKK